MKHSKESCNIVRQNEKIVQKSQKHDANLQKNSTLYFQVGLILCLLASYAGLEMRFEKKIDNYDSAFVMADEDVEITMDKFKIYEEPKIEVKPKEKKQPVVIKNVIIVVDNNHKEAIETLELVTEPIAPSTNVVLKADDEILDIEKPDVPVSIMIVQKVPVYPGCESATNNKERRKCMSAKLAKHIQRKFDSNLGSELGLSKGKHQIFVNFKINKNGEVEVLKTRAPHPELEKEANRVISKVPKMQPGINNKKAVEVLYTMPIKFQVRD